MKIKKSTKFNLYHNHYDDVRNLGVDFSHDIVTFAKSATKMPRVQSLIVVALAGSMAEFSRKDLYETINYEANRALKN